MQCRKCSEIQLDCMFVLHWRMAILTFILNRAMVKKCLGIVHNVLKIKGGAVLITSMVQSKKIGYVNS